MYRRFLHDEIGYFDADVHNYWDWDFYLRAAKDYRVKRVPCASVIYAFSDAGTISPQTLAPSGSNIWIV